MPHEPPQYVIYCPRCGDAMVETYCDRIEGTVCESTDECNGCGYVREWSYGHSQEAEKDVGVVKMIGMYDHLNREDYFKLHLGIPSVVESVRSMNYGEHRFLSELVRQRKADERYAKYPEFKHHTDMLETLLNEGYY